MQSILRSRQVPLASFRILDTIKNSTQCYQFSTNSANMQNDKGQGVSHAGDSAVPQKIQEKAPSSVEHQLPDSVHDTGSNQQTGKVSHAVGDSKVPQALQEALPEKVEKAVPNVIHDTGNK